MKYKAPSKKSRSAAKAIIYEYKMFSFAYREVVRLEKRPRDTPTTKGRWNLALEGVLLHARNLRDFFVGSSRPDDISTRDFFGSQPGFRLTRLRSLAVRHRLNKKLAHLTYSRPRYKGSWPVSVFRSEIDAAWTLFLARLESQRPEMRKLFAADGF